MGIGKGHCHPTQMKEIKGIKSLWEGFPRNSQQRKDKAATSLHGSGQTRTLEVDSKEVIEEG